MKGTKVFPLILTDEQHATIKRRAKQADKSMKAYIVELAVTGKINSKPK